MSVIPPMVPIVVGRCWHNTGKYIPAQGQIHRHQRHAGPWPDYRDGQETPALESGARCPESRGLCGNYRSSTAVLDRIETLS
jgi:hypothetical protein